MDGLSRPKETPPPSLEKSIRTHLAPLLREEGFSGSGRTFRRFGDRLAHAVQVWGGRYGGELTVALGVHPLNVPLSFGVEFRKMGEGHCEFRKSLPSEGADECEGKLMSWSYRPTQLSMDNSVSDAAAFYVARGRPAFAAISAPDSPLFTLTARRLIAGDYDLSGFENNKVRLAYTLAKMRRAEGDLQAARDFARFALRDIGDGQAGSGLVPELRAILEG
jgi:hypothetical protein